MKAVDQLAISWFGIVVPAHDEEELLPSCVSALRRAAAQVDVAVELLVVLDACTDGSAAAASPVATVAVDARNVGVARRTGFDRLLATRAAGVADQHCWLATTDADSVVPADWLIRMAAHAAAGWDAVAGTVRVVDWSGHTAQVKQTWHDTYDTRDHHPHVHGANLGVRADAYQNVGGMPALGLSEDAELVSGLQLAGRAVLHAGDLAVTTSGRRQSRTEGGFATFLRDLSDAPALVLP